MQNGKMWRDEAEEGEFGGEGAFAKGQRRSSNSLESFYSNSGQSSSSKSLQAECEGRQSVLPTPQLNELCNIHSSILHQFIDLH